jgi:2-polyprenyl-6-methoxyphenol hydroxylase-like FAD-dependent oxidoreductase
MKKVLVVGAGIAGCTASIVLARRGWSVTLIEKSSTSEPISSGIFVYSNGLDNFNKLGLLTKIEQAGFLIPNGRNVYMDNIGNHITDVVYPRILGIRRSAMHRVLAEELKILGVEIQLNTTIDSYSFDNFDLVIGADGINSSVRNLFWPEVTPVYSEFEVWRSTHKRPKNLVDKITMFSAGKRLGIMPISDDELYVWGVVHVPEKHLYERNIWSAVMYEKFLEFEGPARPLLDELTFNQNVYFTPAEEVIMPTPWNKNNVLLIGDAAHASTPFSGQGGSMAVHDAVLLGELLDANIELSAFGERRYPMCKYVQDTSRAVGVAGATESYTSYKEMIANMPSTAQSKINNFYNTLNTL